MRNLNMMRVISLLSLLVLLLFAPIARADDALPKIAEKFEVNGGWSGKPILLGQSRGGLMMLAWAMRHRERTRAFVGIYPVCNLQSWPMKNVATTLADYNLAEAVVGARLAEFNPLDNLQGL